MIREEEERPDLPAQGADPTVLGSALGAFSERLGWSARLRGARVHEHWNEIAGDQLARHVEPVRLAGGVLVVRASSPAWATQVRYLAPQLLARANEVLGPDQVHTVTVAGGSTDQRRKKGR